MKYIVGRIKNFFIKIRYKAQIQKAMSEVRAMCDNYEDRINVVNRIKNN